MIEVDISEAFFIYLLISISIIFFFWIWDEYKARTKASEADLSITVRCQLCLEPFLCEKGRPLVHCPYCKTLNEVGEVGS